MMRNFFNDEGFLKSANPIKADIKESENEYIIEAEMPGVKKDEIKLNYKDDILTISYEKEEKSEEEKDNYIRRERSYGTCSRSFYVENIDSEGIKAKHENGILSITLPKDNSKKEKNKTIEIN